MASAFSFDSLNPAQREAVGALDGPVLILAGAGTGKTRTVTCRIAHMLERGVRPQNILAVTFTNKAASEMRERIGGMVSKKAADEMTVSTFHSLCVKLLRGGIEKLGYKRNFAIFTGSDQIGLMKQLIVRKAGADEKIKPEAVMAEISRAKNKGIDPGELENEFFATLGRAYQNELRAQNAVDFDDLLVLAEQLLREHADVRDAFREQFKRVTVDEFQDTNALQMQLLQQLVGPPYHVCVVGDDDQSIYGWRGAEVANILQFERFFPDPRIIRLEENYRSTHAVLHTANSLIKHNLGRREKILRSTRAGGTPVRIVAMPGDAEEAEFIAEEILADKATSKRAWEDFAILFRTNGQSEAFESALADQGVPYLVRGGERFFSRREVRDAILLLRGAARSDDASTPLPELVRDVLLGAGWTREAPSSGGAGRERWESLSALAALSDDLVVTSPEARLPDFIRELDERASAQHAPAVQGVTLASLHAAKGLEWDVVFLAGVSDGYLPIMMAETPEAIEEERRLMYVGVTRARRELRLSWSGARTPGARASRRPSRFLDGAASILGDGARSQPKGSAKVGAGKGGRGKALKPALPAHCRSCGTELTTAAQRKTGRCDTCPPTYSEATFERLRAWRLAVARETSVPAYVVFTDATLTVIAEREPGSEGELAQISGVGARKLGLYGAQVLALISGEDVESVLETRSAATDSDD